MLRRLIGLRQSIHTSAIDLLLKVQAGHTFQPRVIGHCLHAQIINVVAQVTAPANQRLELACIAFRLHFARHETLSDGPYLVEQRMVQLFATHAVTTTPKINCGAKTHRPFDQAVALSVSAISDKASNSEIRASAWDISALADIIRCSISSRGSCGAHSACKPCHRMSKIATTHAPKQSQCSQKE